MSKTVRSSNFSPVQRLALDGCFAALYVVFGVFLSFPVGTLEISWSTLPILLASLALSPWDGAAVALVGSFLEQVMGPYGITATMPLWMLPVILQALFVGFAGRFLQGKFGKVGLAVAIVFAELLLTALNVGVSYLDALLLDYLAYLSVDVPLRFLNGGVRAVLSCVAVPLLLLPLQKLLRKAGR